MKKEIKVSGMSCSHCENRVKMALEEIDGIDSVVASAVDGQVVMTMSKEVDHDVIKEAIEENGYDIVE